MKCELSDEKLGEFIYRAMYEHKGGLWSAVETRDVWYAMGSRLRALAAPAALPPPDTEGEAQPVAAMVDALKAAVFKELGEPDHILARWAQGAEPFHYWSRESIEAALAASPKPSDPSSTEGAGR